jgi:hypothetical protein
MSKTPLLISPIGMPVSKLDHGALFIFNFASVASREDDDYISNGNLKICLARELNLGLKRER